MSESEELLFGGPLLYDASWAQYEDSRYALGIRKSAAALPRLLGLAVSLSWRADRRAVLVVTGAEVVRGAAQAVVLLGVNAALSELLAGGAMEERLRQVLPIAVLLAAVSAVAAVCKAVSTRFSEPLGPRVERVVRQTYLERACRVEMTAMEDHGFHRLLESARYGTSSARRMVDQSVMVVTSLLSLVAMAGVLTRLHWALMVMLAVMVLPNAWATLAVARHRYESFQRWLQHDRAMGKLCELLTDTDTAAEVRVHDAGGFLLTHHRLMSEAAESEQERLAKVTARLELAAAALTGLATVATYTLLGGLLWTEVLALAGAGTAVLAIRQGASGLDALITRVNFLHRESMHVADLRRLLDESADRLIPTGGKPLPSTPAAIRLENVTFTYPGTDTTPALNDVTLTIPTGGIVALVGENGSGKTTLAKLLSGLYLPDDGRILWDDIDATEADRADVFSRFALVQQDHVRWPMTAATNVAISRTDRPRDEDRLAAAAQHAGAGFVDDLPFGWRTLLSRTFQRGVQLSGGQWQRLGIARAHYRAGEILIVDEPTAALDARAEESTFRKIRALADQGQTILLITHRMASVQHADLVYVLHEGHVIESGSPTDLLADPAGHYRALFDIQAAAFTHRANDPQLPRPHRHPRAADNTAS